MKKLTTLILLCLVAAAAIFSSCTDYSDDIKKLQEQIDALSSDRINTIDGQVASIKASLSNLQSTDKELQTYIDGLKSQLETLTKTDRDLSEKIEQLNKDAENNKEALSQLEEYKSLVSEQIETLKSTIETLQAKDNDLQSQIDNLKTYTDTGIKTAKDWASATFATMEQYDTTASIVATISAQIETINSEISLLKNVTGKVSKEELEKAIAGSRSAIEEWVNSLLKGYYTAEQTDAKLAALKEELGKSGDGDVDVESLTKDYEAKLSEAKKEMTEAYTAAISKAINDYDGVITSKIASEISEINGKISAIQTDISKLTERMDNLEKRVADLEEIIKKLTGGDSEGEDEGEDDDVSLTIAEFINKANNGRAYNLKGKVLNYKVTTSATGNSYSFDILDDTGSILVSSFQNIEDWKNSIEIGWSITLSGTYNYRSETKQHEVVDASIIGCPPSDYNQIETLSIQEFLERKDTKNIYKLTGTVRNFNSTYCSFNLTDDSGSVYVYNLSPASYSFFASDLSNGAKVTLYGGYYYYENPSDPSKSKAEILGATITYAEYYSGGDDYQNAQSVTVAEFITAADKSTYYKLSGTVSSFNSKYCSFDLTDDSGKIYVYSVANKTDWVEKISNGGKVTLAGKYDYYSSKSQHEVVDAYILSFDASSDSGDSGDSGDETVAKPTNATKVTIAEFLTKEVNTTDWYEITGTITNIAKEKYGNFYVEDETGNVFVYGLTKEWADRQNDQSFSQIGLKVGDKVTFWTLRNEYNGKAQAGGSNCPALYISHEAAPEETNPAGSVVLTFPDDNRDNNQVNGYTDTWTAKIGSNEFSIENFNNWEWNWTYIKCGRRQDVSVAKISTSTAVEAKIAKVIVSTDSYDETSVNSLVMNVYSDSAFSTKVCSVDMTSSAKTGDIEFAVPTENQAKGLYYEIVFDCKVSTAKKNGFVQVSKVAYIAAE